MIRKYAQVALTVELNARPTGMKLRIVRPIPEHERRGTGQMLSGIFPHVQRLPASRVILSIYLACIKCDLRPD